MIRDNAVANGEPKSRAFANLLGCKERFEDLGHILNRDANSRIFDLDRDTLVLRRRAECEFSALGHCVDRVGCKGDNGLLDLAAVGVNGGKVVSEFKLGVIRPVLRN